MSDIDVSIVILVKNGSRYLDPVLRAVFSQEINKNFEVLVFDSGSTDRSPDIARNYKVKYRRINPGEFNHGLTRNFAASVSRGRFIAFLSQDAEPLDKYWLRALVEGLESDGQIAGVYSRQLPRQDAGILTKVRVSRFFTASSDRRESRITDTIKYNRLSPREKYRFCNFDNVSSCVRKDVLIKLPFPKTDFAEDLEWAKKALEAGYKIVYEPGSAVLHSHEYSPAQWYARTRISYARIYSIFGEQKKFGLLAAARSFAVQSVYGVYLSRKQAGRLREWFFHVPQVLVYSFLGALGEYSGVRLSKR